MIKASSLVCLWIDGCRLLAGEAQYVHMGRRFRRGGSGIAWTDLLMPMAIVLIVIGVAWLVARYLKLREERRTHSPHALFAELCQAHGLDWSSQQLLIALASANQLPSPAQLFVEPGRFETDQLGAAFANRTAQVAALRARLFDATSSDEG